MDPPPTARPYLGIALKIASTIAFTGMATLVKLASERYPIGELTFFRSFFAIIPVFIWVAYRGELPTVFRTRHIGQHLIRSVAGTSAMFCGFTALALLPIADATAIGYAAPLLTVVFAVVLLGEKVHIYRWSAVIVGLLGVIVILSDYVIPGSSEAGEHNVIGAGFAIAGAVLSALAATQVRSLVRYENAATIVVYFSLFAALFSLATLPFGWVMPTPTDFAMLVAAGIFGGLGQVFLTQSYRFGDASLIAPFDYTSMLWSLIVSVVVFATWPSGIVLLGAGIVVAAGLFVIWRERQLGIERARSKRAQSPTNTPST